MKSLIFLIKIISVAIFLTLVIGCATSKEITEIKPLVIKPAVIHDTVKAQVVTDTVIIGSDVVKNDTVTLVKYYPKLQKFFVQAKPDSIILFDTVRTTKTIEKIIQTPLLSKLGLFAIGAIIASLLIIVKPWNFIK